MGLYSEGAYAEPRGDGVAAGGGGIALGVVGAWWCPPPPLQAARPRAPAAAAPPRNVRRDTALFMSFFMFLSLSSCGRPVLGSRPFAFQHYEMRGVIFLKQTADGAFWYPQTVILP